jgi:hypothetical protein
LITDLPNGMYYLVLISPSFSAPLQQLLRKTYSVPFLRSCFIAVFRTILKTHNLAPGDFPEIQSFASKLNDVKFSDFANFSQRQIDELDLVLNVEIPKLMSVRCKRLPVNVADLYVKFLTVYVFRLPSIGTTE